MVYPLIKGMSDIVIGSRYVRGNETQGWVIKRRIASGLARFQLRPRP